MRTHHQQPPKLKPLRPLFTCSFFRHCTQTALSPTAPHPPPLPPPPPPPPPPHHHHPSSSSSTSSSTSSQSFTQWRFPLPPSPPPPLSRPPPPPTPPPPIPSNLRELLHLAELQLCSGSDSDRLPALRLLERSLVPNPPSDLPCLPDLMRGVVDNLRDREGAKSATKILLALCLSESNRRVAVDVGAVGAVVEAALELEGAAAERALAALELMCTVPEGAAEVRAHALSVPVMVNVMGRMTERGTEYAISVLTVIYGGEYEEEQVAAPPEEVARAVVLALQGNCSARGRRKGAHLLKVLQESERLDLNQQQQDTDLDRLGESVVPS